MKAHHLRLDLEQHRHVLLPNVADYTLRFWNGPEPVRIVISPKIPAHCVGGFRRATRVRPDWVIDVEAAAALLAKSGNSARRLLRCSPPHTEPAEPAGIGDGSGQRRRAGAAHRCLKDRPFY